MRLWIDLSYLQRRSTTGNGSSGPRWDLSSSSTGGATLKSALAATEAVEALTATVDEPLAVAMTNSVKSASLFLHGDHTQALTFAHRAHEYFRTHTDASANRTLGLNHSVYRPMRHCPGVLSSGLAGPYRQGIDRGAFRGGSKRKSDIDLSGVVVVRRVPVPVPRAVRASRHRNRPLAGSGARQ